MSVLYIAIPVALVLALLAVIAFVSQVRNGQYDDLDTPCRRMLFDDVEQTQEKVDHEPDREVKEKADPEVDPKVDESSSP